ncbi:hypothetical protein [Ferruginibacter profundus]
MSDATFLTFQKFNDEGVARELVARLSENGIAVVTEDSNGFFDPTFASNPLTREIRVKLKQKDFEVAQKILAAYYKSQLEDTDRDYYLFSFSDDELREIIIKPDEWGDFDYELALKILQQRGKEIKPEEAERLRKQRNDFLARPETAEGDIVFAGYAVAITVGLLATAVDFFSSYSYRPALAGWLIPVFIGWHLAYSKKTLPDGRNPYRYSEKERNHGVRILLLGTLCLAGSLLIRWFNK